MRDRAVLFDLDQAIQRLTQDLPEHPVRSCSSPASITTSCVAGPTPDASAKRTCHERHHRHRRHARAEATRTYRWIRQLHLWIGAWGALAAVIYGFTGLVMNHRFGDGAWPQGESDESGARELQMPADAQTYAGSLVVVAALDAGPGRAGDPQGSARGKSEGRRQGTRRQPAAEVDAVAAAPRRMRGRWNTRPASRTAQRQAARGTTRSPRSRACTRTSAAASAGRSCCRQLRDRHAAARHFRHSGCGRADVR